ncbi:MAG: hypothetical protein QOF30_2556, partial [Acidimicrobiaceae bacterium]|nr:hypothetical protein [Acidimicrobiaceae bacterium]
MVRDSTRRYDRATAAAADLAREPLASAETERAAVVADWAAISGWTPERIAEVTGLTVREVADSVRPRDQGDQKAASVRIAPRRRPLRSLSGPPGADDPCGAAPLTILSGANLGRLGLALAKNGAVGREVLDQRGVGRFRGQLARRRSGPRRRQNLALGLRFDR